MPRAKTKEELLEAGEEQYTRLMTLINSMSDEMRDSVFSFIDRDKNVRDVLIHLHEWHVMFIDLVDNNMNGISKSFLPKGYTFRTISSLNLFFLGKTSEY